MSHILHTTLHTHCMSNPCSWSHDHEYDIHIFHICTCTYVQCTYKKHTMQFVQVLRVIHTLLYIHTCMYMYIQQCSCYLTTYALLYTTSVRVIDTGVPQLPRIQNSYPTRDHSVEQWLVTGMCIYMHELPCHELVGNYTCREEVGAHLPCHEDFS